MIKKVLLILAICTISACTDSSKETAVKAAKVSIIFASQDVSEPVDYVWPWLDSANSRWFYFNTATRPFGLVNLSPDTEIDGAWGSGYRYNTIEIKGFNHIHAWQLSGLSVMPVSSQKTLKSIHNDYYSAFSHDTEIVKAGYHKVSLERYKVDVELTSTARVGFHRYQYSSNKNRKVLLDLQGKFGPSELTKGEFHQLSDNEFNGYIVNQPTRRRPRATPIFFHIELNYHLDLYCNASKMCFSLISFS